MKPEARIAVVAALCGVVGALAVAARGGSVAAVEAPDVVVEPVDPTTDPFEATRRERVRDVSELPGIDPPRDHSVGERAPAGATGVVTADLARMAPGRTLLVSAHAPEAVLIEPDGSIARTIPLPFDQVFPGFGDPDDPNTRSPWRVELAPGGDVVAIWDGIGVARLAPDGAVRWRKANGATHALATTASGGTWIVTRRARRMKVVNPDVAVWDEALVNLDPLGNLRRSGSLLRPERETDLQVELIGLAGVGGYALHVSDVALVGQARPDALRTGDVLLALREADRLVALGFPGVGIRWIGEGHGHPRALDVTPEGHLLLLVDDGVVELDGDERVWTWSGPAGEPLSTTGPCGTVQRLDNGNTLVTDPPTGRALEVAPDGTVVWAFRSPWRAPSAPDHVASLLQATRVTE